MAGTSIGANLAETQYAISKKKFLDLLMETGILTASEYESIVADCKDLLKLLIKALDTVSKGFTQEAEYGRIK
jgi:hypothetical protein